MTSRGFAAITLDQRAGGVAAASRIMWRALAARWNGACRLLTLSRSPGAGAAGRPGLASRLRFGAQLAASQALGDCRWILFSHLSLARAQLFVPRRFRRPYAVFLHGIEAWTALTTAQRQTLRGAALLIANSDYTARRVRDANPWVGPIAVCPLAVPCSDRAVPNPAAPLDRGGQDVVIVGRIDSAERYKGHDQLLDAWPAVRRAVPDARLVMVGGGDDLPRLRTRAAELALDSSVVFTDFVSDLQLSAIYERAHVLAMPSRNEGFGLVYLEAMAHGLPCVGSVHDAAGLIIEEGTTGYLVDQADQAALTDRLVRLLRDRPLRERMGAAGRRRADQLFSYERFEARLLSLLGDAFGAEA